MEFKKKNWYGQVFRAVRCSNLDEGFLFVPPIGLPAAWRLSNLNCDNFYPHSAEACANFPANFYLDMSQGAEGIIGIPWESLGHHPPTVRVGL